VKILYLYYKGLYYFLMFQADVFAFIGECKAPHLHYKLIEIILYVNMKC
jgi:hypothetical protein